MRGPAVARLHAAGSEGLDERPTNVGVMTGEVSAGQPGVEPPRMLLVFDRDATGEPIRPVEVAAVLTALEEIFLATLLRDAPPGDHRGRDWAWDYDAQSLHIQLAGVELGREPGGRLRVLVAIPWHVYTVPFSAFAYGIAHVFGAPAQEESLFERAREDFWRTRLAVEQPKPEWLEWQAWLEVKHEQIEAVSLHLSEIDVVLAPPRADDAPPQ